MPERGALSNSHLALMEVRLAGNVSKHSDVRPAELQRVSLQTVNQLGTNRVSDHENLKPQTKYVSPPQKSMQIFIHSFEIFIQNVC